jgi:ribosomal protein L29
MKMTEIRQLETKQLTTEVTKVRDELADLRRRVHMGEQQNVRLIRNKRRDLARLLTILSEHLQKEEM